MTSIHKCQCGDPNCDQYTLSTQRSIGFDLETATKYAAADDMLAALAPLQAIADAYDANELDDEARKEWSFGSNTTPHDQIELFQGRGGKRLLTLADAMKARAAITKARVPG